jgi:hypothetical protein
VIKIVVQYYCRSGGCEYVALGLACDTEKFEAESCRRANIHGPSPTYVTRLNLSPGLNEDRTELSIRLNLRKIRGGIIGAGSL